VRFFDAWCELSLWYAETQEALYTSFVLGLVVR
jgi:hypothetical protein